MSEGVVPHSILRTLASGADSATLRLQLLEWKRSQRIGYSYSGFLGGTANSSSHIAHAWARTHASVAGMAASSPEEVPKKGRDEKCRVEAGRQRGFRAKAQRNSYIVYIRGRDRL